MNFNTVGLLYTLLWTTVQCYKDTCLTGYMTDVQSWVDEKGTLTSRQNQSSIDLSTFSNPVTILKQKMTTMRSNATQVRYLSMARCRLTRVPSVFHLTNSNGQGLSETVEYMTFYGNNFQDISSPGALYDVSINATRPRERLVGITYQRQSSAVWSTGFMRVIFPSLKELDLRACSIQVISENIFQGMPNLEALYIGENEVVYIDANAFRGLTNLVHLDFSRNVAYDDTGNFQTLTIEAFTEQMINLTSLDLSYTKMSRRQTSLFKKLGPKLTRISLCETGLSDLDANFFNRTSLKILDMSGNNGALSRPGVLRGIEDTLEVLYADACGLRSLEVLNGFKKLEILSAEMNDINIFSDQIAKTLKNLRFLNLDKNRLVTWFQDVFSLMPNLELVSLRNNNINILSEEMIQDIANINYIALSGNFFVCNCHSRVFMDIALKNENKRHKMSIRAKINNNTTNRKLFSSFHTGFVKFNSMIKNRPKVNINCTGDTLCYEDDHDDIEGKFVLLDYDPSAYRCLFVPESNSIEFSDVIRCNKQQRIDYDKAITKSENLLYILLILPILLLILGTVFLFRRNLKYFYITMRNSALLSVINKDEVLDENAIYNYDVFVSYCNEDRNWVLDHLLPHLEKDCSISACLHERDFQVGHSILENIVSCMDRSKSIMLIISKKFLLSQWCQFEMHLAQHRLLETRREDLILVLLEDIPRRLRPNTLHYLMLTKTYIVWSNNENNRALFWKRLKKTLVSVKIKQIDVQGVSIA